MLLLEYLVLHIKDLPESDILRRTMLVILMSFLGMLVVPRWYPSSENVITLVHATLRPLFLVLVVPKLSRGDSTRVLVVRFVMLEAKSLG